MLEIDLTSRGSIGSWAPGVDSCFTKYLECAKWNNSNLELEEWFALHFPQAKISSKTALFPFRTFFLESPKSNPHLLQCHHAMHVGSPWQQNDYNNSRIFLQKIHEPKMDIAQLPSYLQNLQEGGLVLKILINTGCYVFIFRYCLALNTGVKYWNLILQLNVAFLSELNCTEEYRNWILIYELQPPTRTSTSITGNKLHNAKKKYWEFPYSFIGKSVSVNVVNATYVNSTIRRLCSLHSSASEQKYIQEDPFTFTSESIPWSTLNAFIYHTYSRKFWDT